jgi:hypothetical protein
MLDSGIIKLLSEVGLMFEVEDRPSEQVVGEIDDLFD